LPVDIPHVSLPDGHAAQHRQDGGKGMTDMFQYQPYGHYVRVNVRETA